MNFQEFDFAKINPRKIFIDIPRISRYDCSLFNFVPISGDGKYVRVCILDSGVPNHPSIKVDRNKCKNFTRSETTNDTLGHATALAGMISGSRGVLGMSQSVDLYFGKVMIGEASQNNINSVVDSILWAIVQDVDLLLMSFAVDYDFAPLRDAIKKAFNQGIGIIAACGNCTNQTADLPYPARYDEVFAVGYQTVNQYNRLLYNKNKECCGAVLPNYKYLTTFVDAKFVELQGSSFASASIMGLMILLFQYQRRKGINPKNPQMLYKEISKYIIKN